MSCRPLPSLFVGLAILGSACFNQPATPPGRSRIDARFLGEWDCSSVDVSSGERALLTVLRFDSGEYYAEWKEGDKVERYRAYHGDLKGIAILNVTEVSESADGLWSAMRTAFSGDGSMSLALPAERITDMTGDDVRLRTFRREADQPSAWQPFARCVPHKE
jgi:hypothetical protein